MKSFIIFIIFALVLHSEAIHLQMTNADGIDTIKTADLSPFTKIGNKYYWIEHERKVNWFEAAHICHSKGTYLTSIETEEEQQALSVYLRTRGYSTSSTDWLWIGANDLIEENHFHWVSTGLPMTYTKWYPNEPNNVAQGEHCVNLWRRGDEFLWNDDTCSNKYRFICEAPIPKTVAFTMW